MARWRRGDVVIAEMDKALISVVAALVARIRGALLVSRPQDLYPKVAHALGKPLAHGPLTPLLKAIRNRSIGLAEINVIIGQTMRARIAKVIPSGTWVEVIPNWNSEGASSQSLRQTPTPACVAAIRKNR